MKPGDLRGRRPANCHNVVQSKIVSGFLPDRNPAPGEGGCASGKALRGEPAARSAALAERRKLGGSALPRAEGGALSRGVFAVERFRFGRRLGAGQKLQVPVAQLFYRHCFAPSVQHLAGLRCTEIQTHVVFCDCLSLRFSLRQAHGNACEGSQVPQGRGQAG